MLNSVFTYSSSYTAANSAAKKKRLQSSRSRSWTIRIFVLAVMIILFSFVALLHAYALSPANVQIQNHAAAEHSVISVKYGDSLWSIAKEHADQRTDIRIYVDKMMKLNKLKSANLQIGQKLLLP